jgi:predicted nucleic acid-binding protein
VKYLVDTNVISEIRKGQRGQANALNWWASVRSSDIYLSVLSLGEIRFGILSLQKRDAKQARFLEAWLQGLGRIFAGRLLPIDENSAMIWAEIRKHRTVPMIDGLMAATAISGNLVFVTRNTRDIQDVGVQYFNPFESQGSSG